MASEIQKGAIISYISIFLNIAITFIYTPWMISKIGVPNYGLYCLVGAFLSYFIMDFGLSGTITRFIAKYRAEKNEIKIQNMLGLTTKVYLTIDAIIFIVLLAIYPFISHIFTGLTNNELNILKILYVIAGIFSLMTFALKPMDGAMMAYEYFVANRLLDMIQKVGTVALIVLALFLGGSVYELVLITGACGFCSALAKAYVFKRKSMIKINLSYYNKSEMKQLLSFSGWMFLTGLALRFRLTLIPSILGIFADSTEISVFSLGMTIEAMVFTISSALNGLFLPKVSRLVHVEDQKNLLGLMIRVGRIQLYIISLIIMGFAILGNSFLSLWVGEKFSNTYYVVILLILTNIISLTQSVALDIVYAENKIKYTSRMMLATSFMSLIGSCIFAPYYGAIGCAMSFFIFMAIYQILINIFYYKELKIDIACFFKECHLKILPLLMVISLFFYLAKGFVYLDSWINFVTYATLYTIVSLNIIFFILMNADEKQLVNGIIKKIIRK